MKFINIVIYKKECKIYLYLNIYICQNNVRERLALQIDVIILIIILIFLLLQKSGNSNNTLLHIYYLY